MGFHSSDATALFLARHIGRDAGTRTGAGIDVHASRAIRHR